MEHPNHPDPRSPEESGHSSDAARTPSQEAAEAATAYLPITPAHALRPVPATGIKPPMPHTRSIFEKLGSPERFLQQEAIPEGMVAQELAALRKLLIENRIQLLVSSPNISDRELYRFMTGEFMHIRITDDGSPLFHCFLYDDYHPDPFFDNEQTALNRCIRFLLDKNLQCATSLFLDHITLNQYPILPTPEALDIIHAFKERYDEIITLELNPGKTSIRDRICEVSGSHATGFIRGNKCLLRSGRWNVQFCLNAAAEWKISAIRIEDVEL
jgi:hypothetical protein